MSKQFTEYDAVIKYKEVLMDSLKHSFPMLHAWELSDAIDYSIIKRCKNPEAVIDNNYTKKTINTTVLEVLDYIAELEPIVTSSGVLFKQHKQSVNPLTKMVMGFIESRSKAKKQMFKYPKGSEMFEKYNLMQLLEKLNANAVYGCIGNNTSMLYNIYVAEAVTRQGRSSISCSIMLFEAFLSNNVKFNSLNEIITFIHNVVSEDESLKYNDNEILDENITLEEAFYKVMNTVDMMIWIPTEKEMQLVWEYMMGLTQRNLNRIYYKNNLYSFADLPYVSNILINILKKLDGPFMDPNEAPEEIKDDLDSLVDLLFEYVYYRYFPIDKLDRIEYMQRDIVCICDTDSTIISFDAWYRFLLEKTYNIDMPIKHEKFHMVDLIKADEFGDKPLRTMAEVVEPEFDYNFYTDEMVEKERLIEPCKVIPQDSLKYSIINIMAYVCSKLVVDYLDAYCDINGSNCEGSTRYEMLMKNEFYFLRVLLTNNRRNYADLQLIQEGNLITDKDSRLAIMGLPINKSTLSESIKKKLKNILYEDVLASTEIDQIHIMKQLVKIEKEIADNIMSGKTDYYKPDNISAMNSYAKNPLEINGIVASLIYNQMKSDDMPAINLEERNKIIKIKIDVNKNNVHKIKDTFPEEYDKLVKLMNHPQLGKKLSTIALPLDMEVPKWILEFVNIKKIVNDNISNFPVESIGLSRANNDSVNFSNIINT